jgi:hypothetical protein
VQRQVGLQGGVVVEKELGQQLGLQLGERTRPTVDLATKEEGNLDGCFD